MTRPGRKSRELSPHTSIFIVPSVATLLRVHLAPLVKGLWEWPLGMAFGRYMASLYFMCNIRSGPIGELKKASKAEGSCS